MKLKLAYSLLALSLLFPLTSAAQLPLISSPTPEETEATDEEGDESQDTDEEDETPTPVPNITVLTTQGISGDIDIKDRDPVLTFSTEAREDGIHILADAAVNNGAYTKYPLRFDFFVNGTLYSSQIRSNELPSPVGVIVDTQKTRMPFNYTIVVTLITPNREFSTTAYGAITEEAELSR